MSQPVNPMTLPTTWDIVAVDYQAEIEPQFAHFAKAALDCADVSPGQRIADIACGPGTLAFLAAQRKAKVSALDFAPAMIKLVQERATRENLSLEAVVGDGQALPWPENTFDAAFSMFGLMFFPDRQKGFHEVARVLKPGGRAVVGSWVPVDRVPLMADIYGTLAKLLPGLPFGEAKSPLSVPDECLAEMRAGGFRDVRVQECRYDLDLESVDIFWATVQRSTPPVRLLKDKVGPVQWEVLSSKVLETVRGKWGGGKQVLSMLANLIVGIK